MRLLEHFRHRLRAVFQKQRLDQDLDAELSFHLERQVEENLAAGMGPQEARLAALRESGGIQQTKEECRDMRGVTLVENLFQDLSYGVRMLRKNPGFGFVAVLTLAIGMGAATAVFSFVDTILFRPPAVHDPARLLSVFTTAGNEPRSLSSYADFLAIQAAGRTLHDAAAHSRVSLSWAGQEQAQVIWGVVATEKYFATLGVAPALGRVFDANDRGNPVLVLENRFWREQWGSDPAVLGKAMRLGAQTYTIVGIMPEGFAGTRPTFAPSVWIPLDSWDGMSREDLLQPARKWLEITARLRPGYSAGEAAAELAAFSRQLEPIAGQPREQRVLAAMTLQQARISRDRAFVFISMILTAVVGIVLLVVSSNVASLLLTRAVYRRREIALRQSLGATRSRIVRQLLTESLLLAGLGAAAGTLVSAWALNLLVAYPIPSPSPVILDFRLDWRALAFTALAGTLTSILFGLLPALEATRSDLAGRIGRQQQRVRRGLDAMVAVQMSGGFVLLTGAWLFSQALGRAEAVDPGLQPDHALAVTVNPSLAGVTRDQASQLYAQLLERARAIPGVQFAALAQSIPLGSGSQAMKVKLPGGRRDEFVTVRFNTIDGDFFPALGTRLLQGRAFGTTASAAAVPVAIINPVLARTLFAERDPIGERLCLAGPPAECREIVGLAEQGKYFTLAEEPLPYFWIPFAQRHQAQMTLVVRTRGEPGGYVTAVRRMVAEVDSGMPILEIKTLREHMRIPMLEPQIPAVALTALSAIGLLLSFAGIFGVTMYGTGIRRKEMAIRMAVGAGRGRVLWLVLSGALKVVAIAIVIGTGLSVAFGKLVASLLYGLNPADPLGLAGVALCLTAAMLIGSLLPAYSATTIDPAVTLRED